jgi:hypothetical protein
MRVQWLEAAETHALLNDVNAAYRTHVDEVLLTAFVTAVAQSTSSQRCTVGLTTEGRALPFVEGDAARTVGAFAVQFPLLLDLAGRADPGERLKSIKESVRAVPLRGLGWSLLRTHRDAQIREQLANREPTFAFVYHPSGHAPDAAKREARHSLELVTSVQDQRLCLVWRYREAAYEVAALEAIERGFVGALRDLIAHCRSPQAGGFTPSDFAQAKVKQKDLDKLLSTLGKKKEPRR